MKEYFSPVMVVRNLGNILDLLLRVILLVTYVSNFSRLFCELLHTYVSCGDKDAYGWISMFKS